MLSARLPDLSYLCQGHATPYGQPVCGLESIVAIIGCHLPQKKDTRGTLMKAEIISIGTELLLGEIVDTNTPYLAGQLSVLGIDLYFTSAVGDNMARLKGVLKQAWDRSDIILTTGGLGPTQDDLTRDAIASLVGEKQTVDPQLKQNLINFFARRGLEMPASNVKQAALIPSSTALVLSLIHI